MRFDPPGRWRDVGAFQARLEQVDASFRADEELTQDGPLAQPLALFGRVLSNRLACHPMEGWDGTGDGQPSALTLRRWSRFGASGAALVWGGEAYAVSNDGRANPRQLCLESDPDPLRSLTALRAALASGARAGSDSPQGQVIGLQLTHSGRFARPSGVPAPRTAFRHALLERKYPHDAPAALLSDAELERIAGRFLAAARLARDAGFDFVDLKCCHGYLLHELLAARSRSGPYGGPLAGRARLLLQLVAAIRADCPGLGIGVRLSVADTLPYEADPDSGIGRPMSGAAPYQDGFGAAAAAPAEFDLAEPLALLALLRQAGVAAVNLSLGSPYWNPHLQRPAAFPPSDGYAPPGDPLAAVFCHLAVARAVKAALPDLVLVGSGYSYLQEWIGHVAQHELRTGHVDLVGLGRALLPYPELPRDLLVGRVPDRRRLCRTFSDCTTAPRHGLVSGCYPLDPFYRARPEAQTVRALRPAVRS